MKYLIISASSSPYARQKNALQADVGWDALVSPNIGLKPEQRLWCMTRLLLLVTGAADELEKQI
jgi:hypothetical protein